MTSTEYDVTINGVKARILQGVEGGAYTRRSVRREIQNQIIAQSQNPTYRNRDDGVAIYQSSWAGGARWWKPLITPEDLSSYFQSNHMDTWSEPGKVVPANKHTDAANTNIHDNCVIGTDGVTVYAIGETNTTNASGRDVYVWTPASNSFVRATAYYSGIQDDSEPVSMVYDSSDGYFYVLAQTLAGGREVGRFNPSTPATNLTWLTGSSSIKYGSAIITSPYGVFFNAGDTIRQIDKSGPSHSAKFDPANAEFVVRSNTNIVSNGPLFVSTPQGMYLARNTLDAGQPVCVIYRIDRDTSGAFIGNPIATLPRGSVCLSIQFHLGQLYCATTPDWRDLATGTTNVEIVFYYVGEGGMGALGSLLGGRDEKDETPYRILGAEGEKLFIAGSKRLWVYDSIRGGLHTAWEWETVISAGGYKAMARGLDSAGDEIMIFLGKDRINYVKVGDADNPDTVTNFGDDETHYVLTSNFFDGNLPMEQKEITEVAILREADDGGSEWTVQISADEGAFSDALVSSGTDVYDSAVVSGVSGYQFQYRLIYQTKDTARSALRALLVSMTTGDMVTEWDLVLDGSELLNMDNERQDPADFVTSMNALGANSSIINFVDNYVHERDLDIDDSSNATKVKVVAVELIKDVPGESRVRVLLRGS